MALVTRHNILVEPVDLAIKPQVESLLREEHGAHGLNFIGAAALFELRQPIKMSISNSVTVPNAQEISFRGDSDDVPNTVVVEDGDSKKLHKALSDFAVGNLMLTIDEQSSRVDKEHLADYSGESPNIVADPSRWIVGNPFIADLHRRYPDYGNLVRFINNERGLFLKVGNYPGQRAYWNSTTNGGLPIFKKADPIHEGTFMLHDLYHFVPTDPIIGGEVLRKEHKSTYLAHRLMSEATTLVLADMIAVDDARLKDKGYDTSKRRIFPVYESIIEATGEKPNIDKLLAANVYFCFTADPQGFKDLGASDESIDGFRGKYESIFRDDFMWNLNNYEFMADEQSKNPDIAKYYSWLSEQSFVPNLDSYTQRLHSNGNGLSVADMLSFFRADYTKALSYQQPIIEDKRIAKAAAKYAAGQKVTFARFAGQLHPGEIAEEFDDAYINILEASDTDEVERQINRITSAVGSYISKLLARDILLPHEAKLYHFNAPLYPVSFVNYHTKKVGSAERLSEEMNQFISINNKQLDRLLEIVNS